MFTKRICCVLAMLALTLTIGAGAADDQPVVKNIKAVNWEELAGCLPDKVEGLHAGEIDGGTITMADPTNPQTQMSYSAANRTYYKGKDEDDGITLTILDSNLYQFLLMPFMMAIEIDTPNGSVKSTKLGDFPSKVIIEKDDGEITGVTCLVLISERILVSAEGDDSVSQDDVESLIKKVDFEKLASLVK
ncbi:MAG: hypothetical protein JW763_04925 [candidate division Zixibacteria bacterium]|nr:hypothetical protein [candidate division Zixibacteria bacterium]